MLLSAMAAPFAAHSAPAASLPKALPTGLETQIRDWMAYAGVPGLVVGDVQGGRLAWHHAFGVTNANAKDPVTKDTLFQAASLTKQVTAYVAHALADKGKLDFSQTLVSYIDDLPEASARKVTIQHVLSHSSGFPNWRGEKGQTLKPAFEPGSRWQYSGEGYVYLSRIIEKVTGKSFAEAVNEFVLQPLEMKSTSLFWTPQFEGRYAFPHSRRGEVRAEWNRGTKRLHEYASRIGKPLQSLRYDDLVIYLQEIGDPPLPNWMTPNAAASMMTTAEDYGRFVAAAMKNPKLKQQDVEMRSGKDWSLGWGPGWGIERTAGREYLWQWGDNGGFKNIVLAEPATGHALFVFTNGDGGAKVYDRIAVRLSGHEHPALVSL